MPLTQNKVNPSEGSRIGIVASSMTRLELYDEEGQIRSDKIDAFRSQIEDKIKAWGFNPIFPKDSIDPPIAGLRWSNTAEERARHMINMLNNPDIEAIMQIDGGESAIEVVDLLDQYDKNRNGTEEKIKNAYRKRHGGEEPPEDYFLPRLESIYYTDSFGREHGLPKRGIPHCGFSDGSGLNNFLGQRGVVRPYYANLPGGPLEALENITQHLAGEVENSTYSGLTLLNGKNIPKGELNIYATVLGWLSSSCGTSFQFHLKEPSILAIESIEFTENIGRMLLQAQDSGMLDNVHAILMGTDGTPQTIDPSKINMDICPSLVKFLDNTDIPFLVTEKDTFGHGPGVPKSFANFASASFGAEEAGKYCLTVKGRAHDLSLASYYDHRSKDLALHPALDATNDTDAIIIDWESLRFTNGTSKQINVHGKDCVICVDKIIDFTHLALIEGLLSGSLAGAKSIIFAVAAKEKIIDPGRALQVLTHTRDIFKQSKTNPNEFIMSRFPDENWLLGPLASMGIKVASCETAPEESEPTLKRVKILFEDGEVPKIMDYAQRYNSEIIFSQMLKDAAGRHLGDTPLYMIHDQALSQSKGITQRPLNEVIESLTEPLNPSPTTALEEKVNWVDRTKSNMTLRDSREI